MIHLRCNCPTPLTCMLTRLLSCLLTLAVSTRSAPAADVNYEPVAKIFNEYCAGCHNDADREGDLSLASYTALMAGTSEGSLVVPGQPEQSKLFRVLTGLAEPSMPPEDEAQPSEADIEILRTWIAGGALADAHPAKPGFVAPSLPPAQTHYVSAACRVAADTIAFGELGRIVARRSDGDQIVWQVEDLPGKVNSLRMSDDRRLLVAGTGVTGAFGEIVIIDASHGQVLHRFSGHNDTVYCAALSPDGSTLASGSYDHQVLLWDLETGQILHRLTGHNGPIYDLDFSPDGSALATASGDQTVKLWNLQRGERLDTFGQPEGEMRCVRFSRDGRSLFGAGADRQIRQWQVISTQQPVINPMLHARFAHESGILQLEVLDDGWLISTAEDLTVKRWSAEDLDAGGQLMRLQDVPVAIAPARDGKQIAVVELTGNVQLANLSRVGSDDAPPTDSQNSQRRPDATLDPLTQTPPDAATAVHLTESEPNDQATQATPCELPAVIEGVIDAGQARAADVDHFRFHAEAGQTWVFEVTAASNQSPLDSWIDILDDAGQGVVRTRLQAVRESYFTFRGKDSSTSDDFRLHKWEDMELDEYLYSSGEVTRLWLYPRGPDSGFKVYPGSGSRYTFFGTTPVAHALGEPAYVVRELKRDEEALPNGLPVFPIYYENDDDPLRRAGRDSRLDFVAPETGDYILRIRDARGFGGPDYAYRIAIRRPVPDFTLTVSGHKMSMPKGSGREWKVEAKRIDGLDAPIVIELSGIPEGFLATNPLVIEAGQEMALGTIYATQAAILPLRPQPDSADETAPAELTEPASAPAKPEYEPARIELVARSRIGNEEIVHAVPQHLELLLNEDQEVQLTLVDAQAPGHELEELTIRPGQTVSARLVVERGKEQGSISFGKDDSGRNLPHGAFVDNIGLNGLLIPEGQTEREFFITAAPKLQPGRRQFHLRCESKGNATSRPVWLNVLPAGAASRSEVASD